jgi:hypothetical protein
VPTRTDHVHNGGVGQIDREDRVKPEDAVMLRWSMKAKPVLRGCRVCLPSATGSSPRTAPLAICGENLW